MKIKWNLLMCVLMFVVPLAAFAEDDIAKKMADILMKAPEEDGWQVTVDEVNMWLKTKKMDFVILDARPDADEYTAGHIPGAIHMPYYEILKPENLKNLPKDKKIILVCATGQLQNLPVVPLRVLGYDAYTLLFGYTAWIKDYPAGEAIKSIINKAAAKNYPLEQTGGSK